MHLSITAQKLSRSYSQSSRDFVNYLEKENRSIYSDSPKFFFNQEKEVIPAEDVIQAIDGNKAKLSRSEPKFYAITICPSQKELIHIGNSRQKLKEYTREIMKNYVESFNREVQGRSVRTEDILYFGKIESTCTFKRTDPSVKENAPFLKKIATLEKTIRKVESGKLAGNAVHLKKQMNTLKNKIPHKINGKAIEKGMLKPGIQTHIHLIVSRKDRTNTYSLSPGSAYRSSEVMMHGKIIKRGFERDRFFQSAEKTFDRIFDYNRNYVESYSAKKTFIKDSHSFYTKVQQLPPAEKKAAFLIMNGSGRRIPQLNISSGQISFALKQVRKALEIGVRSSSIDY